ncbi:trimeric LpxA-like protein [Usnea florida]
MAARPSFTNRSSTSKPPTPPLNSTPTTLISASASCTGTHPITLGPKTIVQLRARLTSDYGPIDVGKGCIISARASVGLLSPPRNEMYAKGVTISPNVLIETGAIIEGASIGAYTIVEAGAKIGKGTVIGANSKVCAGLEIGEGIVIGDNTVVYGSGWGEQREAQEGLGLDGMRKVWMEAQEDSLRRTWTGK